MYDIKKQITGEAAGTEEIKGDRNFASGHYLSINSQKVAPTFDAGREIKGTAPQTTANFGTIYIASRRCTVKAVKAVWGTKTNDTGACTLQVERLQGTEAKGAGDDLLSTAMDMSSGTENNTVYSGTLTGTSEWLTLESSNRLGLVTTGTKASLADVTVTVELEYDPA